MKFCPICTAHYENDVDLCATDGAKLKLSGKIDPYEGKTIRGRYHVLNKIGEGGMGSVYLAEQLSVGRKVALKLLHGSYASDDDFISRFRREARLAAALNHRNIVTLYDFDQADDGSLFIAMEYLKGERLSDLVHREGPFEVDRAAHLGLQIAEGLDAAHGAGVIHRDIKPDNIMVVAGGSGEEIKLMDFGIARLRDTAGSSQITQSGMIMGTPAYMAPEQAEGGEVSEQTDIYALGIVLYEILSGSVPFTAPTPAAVLVKQMQENPIPLRKRRRELPAAIERVVMQALMKNPAKRQRNVAEMAAYLRELDESFRGNTANKARTSSRGWNIIGRKAQSTGSRKSGSIGSPPGRKNGSVGNTPLKKSSGVASFPVQRNSGGATPQVSTGNTERPSSPDVDATVLLAGDGASEPTIFAGETIVDGIETLYGEELPESNPSWITRKSFVTVVSAFAFTFAATYWIFFRSGSQDEVQPPPKVSLAIKAEKSILKPNERTALMVYAKRSDGKTESVAADVKWHSSNSLVAEVNSRGQVEAHAEGSAEIIAEYNRTRSEPFTMVVKKVEAPPPPAPVLISLTLLAPKRELKPNERIALRVKAKYSDGKERDLNNGIAWQSSDDRVITVDANGRVLAHGTGDAQVTASVDGVTSAGIAFKIIKTPILERQVAKTLPATPQGSRQPDKEGGTDFAERVRDGIRNATNLYEDGKYSDAIAAANRILTIDPQNGEARSIKAKAERASKVDR